VLHAVADAVDDLEHEPTALRHLTTRARRSRLPALPLERHDVNAFEVSRIVRGLDSS
jgi:hypothetical protein